jgi:signal peptidase I
MPRHRKKKRSLIIEIIEVLAVSLLIALIIRAYFVQAFYIPYNSMENAIYAGDLVLADKLSFKKSHPTTGDLLMFRYPLNPKKILLSHCVATSGQTVKIIDKTLYIDDKPVTEKSTVKHTDSEIHEMLYSNRDNFGPFLVPTGSIFVLGDNRDESIDSRFWGEIPLRYIQAKPMFVYFSIEPYQSTSNSIFTVVVKFVTFPFRIRASRIFKSAN